MNIEEQDDIIREMIESEYSATWGYHMDLGKTTEEAKELALLRAQEVEIKCKLIRDTGAELQCADCECNVPSVGKYFRHSLSPPCSWNSVLCDECLALRREKVNLRNRRLREEGNPISLWLDECKKAKELGLPRPPIPWQF